MVSESEIWETDVERKREKMPLSDLISGPSGRNLLKVLVMMTGFWLTQNIITIFIPTTLLLHMLKLPKYTLTSTLLISYAALFFSYIAAGMIGQRIGRRRFFIIVGPLIAVMALVCVPSILVTSPWGVIITYTNERFVTDVRATGFGIGFSLSVIIPSFYAFYMNWLGAVMPFELTPVFLLAVGAIIGTIGAAMGPEMKDVDFQ